MYCSECGTQTPDGAAFCAKCGAPFASAAPVVTPAAPPLPPPRARLDVSRAISTSFRVAFAHFGVFLATQGPFVVLGAAVAFLLSFYFLTPGLGGLSESLGAQDVDATLASLASLSGGLLALGSLTFVLRTIGLGIGVVVADAALSGQRIGIATAWSRLRPRVGNLLATYLLVTLAVAGVFLAGVALVFLIVPVFVALGFAIYLLVRWIAAAPVSVLEQRPPSENLSRASAVSEGSRGPIFAAALVVYGIPILLGAIVGAIFQAGAGSPAELSLGAALAQAAISAVFQLVAAFVTSVFLVHAYRELAATARPSG